METEEKSNLPVVQKVNHLGLTTNRIKIGLSDTAGRLVRNLPTALLGVVGVGAAAIVPGTLTVPFLIAGSATFGYAAKNMIFEGSKDLMFSAGLSLPNFIPDGIPVISDLKSKSITQNITINLAKNMKGFSPIKKAGLMQLQTLVGFSKFKTNLEGTGYEELEDGTRIFDQRYHTETHSVNIKTLKALETLGIIKIDDIYDTKKVL